MICGDKYHLNVIEIVYSCWKLEFQIRILSIACTLRQYNKQIF